MAVSECRHTSDEALGVSLRSVTGGRRSMRPTEISEGEGLGKFNKLVSGLLWLMGMDCIISGESIHE